MKEAYLLAHATQETNPSGVWARGATGSARGVIVAFDSSTKGADVRVMVLIKSDRNTEAGALPDTKMLVDMDNYNRELSKAGLLIDGEGLQPSSKGKRVAFHEDRRAVIEGPFDGPETLIAGYWIWNVKSMDEAVEWVKKCPNPTGGDAVLEIRPLYEAEDFGDALNPELRGHGQEHRTQLRKER